MPGLQFSALHAITDTLKLPVAIEANLPLSQDPAAVNTTNMVLSKQALALFGQAPETNIARLLSTPLFSDYCNLLTHEYSLNSPSETVSGIFRTVDVQDHRRIIATSTTLHVESGYRVREFHPLGRATLNTVRWDDNNPQLALRSDPQGFIQWMSPNLIALLEQNSKSKANLHISELFTTAIGQPSLEKAVAQRGATLFTKIPGQARQSCTVLLPAVQGGDLLILKNSDLQQPAERATAEELVFKDRMFQTLVEQTPESLVIIDAAGIIQTINSQMATLFGYTPRELLGHSIERLLPENMRAKHIHLRNHYQSDPKIRPMGTGRPLFGRHKSGRLLPVEISLGPVTYGGTRRVIAVIRDLRNRQQAEQLVRENRLLKDINEELESFAYIASHDLKAPMRAISNLSRWIEEELSESADSDVRNYLELIRSSSHTMSQMLQGLLEYSRIGRQNFPWEEIHLPTMVESIKNLLLAEDAFTLTLLSNKEILLAPRAPLLTLLLNLVSNGVFHNTSEEKTIQIDHRSSPEAHEFIITDNGIGIPPEYREMVFQPFKRLNPENNPAGTGMGLSIVKKTVASLRGSVTISSDTPSGTRVILRLPLAQEKTP